MNEKIYQFLNTNKLWKMRTNTENIGVAITKDTPIYITGDFGPQGKTTLKDLLIEDGYTNVLEMEEAFLTFYKRTEEMYKPSKRQRNIDRIVRETFEKENNRLIQEYMEKGVVIDFGKEFLKL